jgi:N-acetylglucosamine kinase-like BadF-type ATPase
MKMRTGEKSLYVDVGQTGSRVLSSSTTGKTNVAVGFSPNSSIDEVVRGVLESLDNPEAQTVILSLTGLRGKVPELSGLAAICNELTGCTELGVCDDGLAWSVGSLGGDDGVAVAVGGGVVAVSKSGSRFSHIDGNGSDFGDSGGAYWLGKKGIRAAIRGIEGSGEKTLLSEMFFARHGDHGNFVREVVSKSDVHQTSIEFAPSVLEAAAQGDGQALEIIQIGASRLGAVATAAALGAGLESDQARIALGGGLMKSQFYRTVVAQKITQRNSAFRVIEPQGDALDGLQYFDRGSRDDISSLMAWWRK